MPLNTTLTEDLIQRLAPDEASMKSAREIVKGRKFSNAGVSADGTWLLGEFAGSGSEPYRTSIDFIDPNLPVVRCNCPSRKFPCKHGLALILGYHENPDLFVAREPEETLVAKREKKIALETRRIPAGPKKSNKDAADKKVVAQREGLELLEKLLTDLVASGQWFEESRLEKLDRQAKQLNDSFLPAPMYGLRRLILTGRQKDISEDERMAVAADILGQLWATVRKGKAYLDSRLNPDDNPGEADAVLEDILGRTWQYSDLKAKGYCRANVALLELAFERIDDEARQQRLEISNLIDLTSGGIVQAITFRPFKGLSSVPEQPSYMLPLVVSEAAVYPGFVNRRIRWEKGSEQPVEDGSLNHLEKAYSLARTSFASVLDEFRTQLKNPLAPRDMVALVKCAGIGRIGNTIVLQDVAAARIATADRRKDYSNVANLVRAAGMLGNDQPAILVRLFLQPVPNTIAAYPLAALTPKHHLRLGL